MLRADAANDLLARHRLAQAGAPLTRCKAVLVAVHGRGATAGSILGLTEVLAQPDVAALAPQAPGGSWYPHAFIAPLEANQPRLGEALTMVSSLLDDLLAAGVPVERLGLMGFSQGACLAIETAIRTPRRYGCVIGLSGGYIGPLDGSVRRPEGSLDGARAFLGCSDTDPHIPLQRVRETSALMRAMGADVVERIYPGFGHSVNDDEIAAARAMLVRIQD